MSTTVAADPEELRRFCADLDTLLPAVAADAAELRAALLQPVDHLPPGLDQVLDTVRGELDALAAAVRGTIRRIELADRPSVAGDLWQAAQSTMRLARAVLALRSERALAALPVAGTAWSLVTSTADVWALFRQGNPLHAYRRRGLGYLADALQVPADVTAAGCATTANAPTCAAAVLASLEAAELRVAHDHHLKLVPMVPPLPPLLVRASDLDAVGRLAGRLEHGGEHLVHETTDLARQGLHTLLHGWD